MKTTQTQQIAGCVNAAYDNSFYIQEMTKAYKADYGHHNKLEFVNINNIVTYLGHPGCGQREEIFIHSYEVHNPARFTDTLIVEVEIEL